MAFTRCDGAEIWYETRGDGLPLILTGGFGLLDQQYVHVAEKLAEHFRVVNWNWRGAGKSTRTLTAPYSIDVWTRDLGAVAVAAGVDCGCLWGTSSGSLVTIHYAAEHAERVRGLVLYPSFRTSLVGRHRYALYLELFNEFGWEALGMIFSFVGLSEESLSSADLIAFQAWERDMFVRNLDELAVESIFAALSHADVTADLERLSDVPVMLLGGASGRVGMEAPALKESIEVMQKAIKSVTVASIDGAGGTYCMLEKPRETLDAVVPFLQIIADEEAGRAGAAPALTS